MFDNTDWKVRKVVDDTGDYPLPTYSVLAVYNYGPKTIADEIDNPYNARLMAAAPKLLKKLLEVYIKRERNDAEIEEILEDCMHMKIEKIMEVL